MSEGEQPSEGDVFDIDRIRRLVELMQQHDLSEIDLRDKGERIRLTRGGPPLLGQGPAMMMPAPSPQSFAAPQPAAGPPPRPGDSEAVEGAHIVTIRAPMVGTFYARPNPESEPFVKVGSTIQEDSVVCIIEAMKVFNEIPAEVRGRVVAVLADHEQPVDFGKPLFKVDTSG